MGGVGSGRGKRPNREKTIQLSVNLTPNALVLLEAQTKKSGLTYRSKYIEQLIFRRENLDLAEMSGEVENLKLFYSTLKDNLSKLVEMVEAQEERLEILSKDLGLRK